MKFKHFFYLIVGLIISFVLPTCVDYQMPYQGFKLAKNPEVYLYSGGQEIGNRTLSSRKSANVNGNLWYQNWERPTNVTTEEIAKITELMSEPRVGAKNDIHIDWNNYWVQQVYTGEATYKDGNGNSIGTGSSHMNHLLAYSNKVLEQTAWYPEAQFTLRDKYGYEDVYEHINNFNSGANSTEYTDDENGEVYYGTTLMTDMYAEGIIDQFGYHNSTDSKNHYEYIIVEMDGAYYICFDFYATHPEGQDANKNMDVERDWIFNDWIVKISPAYHVGENNGDNNGDDNTDEPEEENPNEDEETPNQPSIEGFDEVEINLSVEEHADYTSTHLSIHLRSATDVEVFIPIPVEYYCDVDDMAIVQRHEEKFMKHGGPDVLVYNVGGYDITLTIKYEEEGIRVTTDGMCQEVLDYCIEHFKDGLTFEVWNYYNESVDRDFINNFLKDNHSIVRFLDKNPSKYINAFNEFEGEELEYDNYVDIVDEQIGEYPYFEEGEHYNGSQYNKIYKQTN